MMNKIFIGLLVLSAIGSGVLFWLMKTLPDPKAPVSNLPKTEVHSTPDGVKIVDKESPEAGDSHAKSGGEHASADDAPHAEVDLQAQEEALEEAKSKTKSPRLNITTVPVPAIVFVDGELKGQTPVSIELTQKKQSVKIEAAGFEEVVRDSPSKKEAADLENLNWRIALKKNSADEKSASKISEEAVKALDTLHAAPAHAQEKVAEKSLKVTAPVSATPVRPVPVKEHHTKTPEKALEKSHEKTVAKVEAPASPEDDEDILHGRGGPAWIQIKSLPVKEKAQMKSEISKFRTQMQLAVVACEVDLKSKGRWYRMLAGPFDNKVEASMALEGVRKSAGADAFVTGVQTCL